MDDTQRGSQLGRHHDTHPSGMITMSEKARRPSARAGLSWRILAVTAAFGLAFLGAVTTASASSHNDGNGANQSGPFDPNGVGEGDNQGNGNAPANGTVGKADGKNPPGQVKNGGDRGYECDDNSGVGNNGGNPAHSGCASSTGTSPPVLPTESTAPTVAPTESSVPGTRGNPGGAPEVLGIARNAPAAVPTAVAGGSGDDSSTSGALWIVLGGGLVLAGLALGLVPAASRGKHTCEAAAARADARERGKAARGLPDREGPSSRVVAGPAGVRWSGGSRCRRGCGRSPRPGRTGRRA